MEAAKAEFALEIEELSAKNAVTSLEIPADILLGGARLSACGAGSHGEQQRVVSYSPYFSSFGSTFH
jgi:hypothetical protein